MQEPTLSEIYRKLLDHVSASSQNYSEIKELLKGQNDKLEAIEIQTVKTNGRVNRLEEDNSVVKNHVDSLRLWRNLLIGGGIVISACGIAFLKLYEDSVIRKSSENVIAELEIKRTAENNTKINFFII